MPKLDIKVINEDPPELTKGKGIPTTGSSPDTIPILTNT